jgi:hypothetical protein
VWRSGWRLLESLGLRDSYTLGDSAKYLLDVSALYPLVLKLGERILSYPNLFTREIGFK